MGEYGVNLPKGWTVMLKQAGAVLGDEGNVVPALLRPALLEQIEQVRARSKRWSGRLAPGNAVPKTANALEQFRVSECSPQRQR